MCCNHCDHSAETSCLSKVPIFNNLTSSEIETLQPVIQTKYFAKGDYIFREGETSDSLFVVNQGTIKISKLSGEGKEKIVRFLFPGDFFGQFALLQEKKHDAHAEVLDAAAVCIIHKQDFLPIIENNAKMAFSFVLAISELLHQAEEWMSTISLLETEQRLAKLLLLFHERNDFVASFDLPVPKKELAALLGTTPETLSRKLASLEERGLISFVRKRVTIHDLEGLKAISY